jgi:secreted trypsin-like serine protease
MAMIRALLLLVIPLMVLLAVDERARAITSEEDIVRDLNETFKAPSTFPPNNALRPAGEGTRNGNGDGSGRTETPFQDEGPPADRALDIVPDRTYPFLVAIVESKRPPQEGYVCAGTLIAPHWVVTAAHCAFSWVRRWPVDPEVGVLFNTTRLSQPGPKVAVTRVIPHPDYDARTLKNDIALLRINTQGRALGSPLKLEGPPIAGQIGEIAHVAGWGVTNLDLAARQRAEVQQLLQVVVRGNECFSGGNFPKLRGTGVFCATSIVAHHDTCYRFGGGPIVIRDQAGERYLGGMVSWPAVCPPQVAKMNPYLDVQHFVPWIKGIIQANGGAGG